MDTGRCGEREKLASATPEHWRTTWRRLCSGDALVGKRLSEFADVLVSMVQILPLAFRDYMHATVCGAESENVPKPRPSGQGSRDLFPLPYSFVSAEELPRAISCTDGHQTLRKVRSSWLLLLVTALNYEYFLCDQKRASRLTFGPATKAQHQALVRLGCCADLLCELNPDALEATDWKTALKTSSVSYSGDEVCIAEALTFAQVAPGLPPPGVAASIPIVSLLEGSAREDLLNPATALLEPEEISATWGRARLRATSRDLPLEVLGELLHVGLLSALAFKIGRAHV